MSTKSSVASGRVSAALRSSSQVPAETRLHNGTILGRHTLLQVHDDMRRTILPSWVTKAPSNIGTARCRSLSADQWRVACTVNLVISLIRLWGPFSEDIKERQMLDNFMDLITAIKLASRRILTEQTINDYQFRMTWYLKRYIQLYPDHGLHPYHHLTLHLPQFLRAYGPAQSWRCFAFEKYNHSLQKIKTNGKFGMYTTDSKNTQ